jgi:hypothetical protein
MFKSLTNYLKSDMCKWICVAVVLVIVAYSLQNYSSTKGLVLDAMSTSVQPNDESTMVAGVQATKPANYDGVDSSIAASTSGNSDYTKTDTLSPDQLLPTDKNSDFANLNPVNQGSVDMPDLMAAGALGGIDTVGQTLKNANMQLRSDPPIKKEQVGPWNYSTFEPDLARVPLELGCSSNQ